MTQYDNTQGINLQFTFGSDPASLGKLKTDLAKVLSDFDQKAKVKINIENPAPVLNETKERINQFLTGIAAGARQTKEALADTLSGISGLAAKNILSKNQAQEALAGLKLLSEGLDQFAKKQEQGFNFSKKKLGVGTAQEVETAIKAIERDFIRLQGIGQVASRQIAAAFSAPLAAVVNEIGKLKANINREVADINLDKALSPGEKKTKILDVKAKFDTELKDLKEIGAELVRVYKADIVGAVDKAFNSSNGKNLFNKLNQQFSEAFSDLTRESGVEGGILATAVGDLLIKAGKEGQTAATISFNILGKEYEKQLNEFVAEAIKENELAAQKIAAEPPIPKPTSPQAKPILIKAKRAETIDPVAEEKFKETVDRTTVSEEKLQAASIESATALKEQEEVARKKAQTMAELAKEVAEVAEKEKLLVAETKQVTIEEKAAAAATEQAIAQFERGIKEINATPIKNKFSGEITGFQSDGGDAQFKRIYELIGKVQSLEENLKTRINDQLGRPVSKAFLNDVDSLKKQLEAARLELNRLTEERDRFVNRTKDAGAKAIREDELAPFRGESNRRIEVIKEETDSINKIRQEGAAFFDKVDKESHDRFLLRSETRILRIQREAEARKQGLAVEPASAGGAEADINSRVRFSLSSFAKGFSPELLQLTKEGLFANKEVEASYQRQLEAQKKLGGQIVGNLDPLKQTTVEEKKTEEAVKQRAATTSTLVKSANESIRTLKEQITELRRADNINPRANIATFQATFQALGQTVQALNDKPIKALSPTQKEQIKAINEQLQVLVLYLKQIEGIGKVTEKSEKISQAKLQGGINKADLQKVEIEEARQKKLDKAREEAANAAKKAQEEELAREKKLAAEKEKAAKQARKDAEDDEARQERKAKKAEAARKKALKDAEDARKEQEKADAEQLEKLNKLREEIKRQARDIVNKNLASQRVGSVPTPQELQAAFNQFETAAQKHVAVETAAADIARELLADRIQEEIDFNQRYASVIRERTAITDDYRTKFATITQQIDLAYQELFGKKQLDRTGALAGFDKINEEFAKTGQVVRTLSDVFAKYFVNRKQQLQEEYNLFVQQQEQTTKKAIEEAEKRFAALAENERKSASRKATAVQLSPENEKNTAAQKAEAILEIEQRLERDLIRLAEEKQKAILAIEEKGDGVLLDGLARYTQATFNIEEEAARKEIKLFENTKRELARIQNQQGGLSGGTGIKGILQSFSALKEAGQKDIGEFFGSLARNQINVEGFEKSLTKLQGSLANLIKGTGGGIPEVSAALSEMTAALGPIAIGIGAFISGTQKLFTELQKISKAAVEIFKLQNQISLATSLNKEIVTTFALGFEQAGAPVFLLDIALSQLVTKIEKVAEAEPRTSAAFKKLGVSVLDAYGRARNLNDIFLETIDALDAMPLSTDKARLQIELFGIFGQKAIGSTIANFKELNKTVKELGLTLTDQEEKQLKDYNFSIVSLQKIFDGIIVRIGSQLAPAFEKLNKAFIEFIKQLKLTDPENIENLAKTAANLVDAILAGGKAILNISKPLILVFNELLNLTIQVFDIFTGRVPSGIKGTKESFEGLSGTVKLLTKLLESITNALKGVAEILVVVQSVGAGVFDKITKSVQALITKVQEYIAEIRKIPVIGSLIPAEEAPRAKKATSEAKYESEGFDLLEFQRSTKLKKAELEHQISDIQSKKQLELEIVQHYARLGNITEEEAAERSRDIREKYNKKILEAREELLDRIVAQEQKVVDNQAALSKRGAELAEEYNKKRKELFSAFSEGDLEKSRKALNELTKLIEEISNEAEGPGGVGFKQAEILRVAFEEEQRNAERLNEEINTRNKERAASEEEFTRAAVLRRKQALDEEVSAIKAKNAEEIEAIKTKEDLLLITHEKAAQERGKITERELDYQKNYYEAIVSLAGKSEAERKEIAQRSREELKKLEGIKAAGGLDPERKKTVEDELRANEELAKSARKGFEEKTISEKEYREIVKSTSTQRIALEEEVRSASSATNQKALEDRIASLKALVNAEKITAKEINEARAKINELEIQRAKNAAKTKREALLGEAKDIKEALELRKAAAELAEAEGAGNIEARRLAGVNEVQLLKEQIALQKEKLRADIEATEEAIRARKLEIEAEGGIAEKDKQLVQLNTQLLRLKTQLAVVARTQGSQIAGAERQELEANLALEKERNALALDKLKLAGLNDEAARKELAFKLQENALAIQAVQAELAAEQLKNGETQKAIQLQTELIKLQRERLGLENKAAAPVRNSGTLINGEEIEQTPEKLRAAAEKVKNYAILILKAAQEGFFDLAAAYNVTARYFAQATAFINEALKKTAEEAAKAAKEVADKIQDIAKQAASAARDAARAEVDAAETRRKALRDLGKDRLKEEEEYKEKLKEIDDKYNQDLIDLEEEYQKDLTDKAFEAQQERLRNEAAYKKALADSALEAATQNFNFIRNQIKAERDLRKREKDLNKESETSQKDLRDIDKQISQTRINRDAALAKGDQKAALDYEKELNDLTKQRLELQQQLKDIQDNKQALEAEKQVNLQRRDLEKRRQEELKKLAQDAKDGKFTKDEYEAQKKFLNDKYDLEQDYLSDKLEAIQNNDLETLKELEQAYEDQRKALEEAKNAELEYIKTNRDLDEADRKKREEDEKTAWEKRRADLKERYEKERADAQKAHEDRLKDLEQQQKDIERAYKQSLQRIENEIKEKLNELGIKYDDFFKGVINGFKNAEDAARQLAAAQALIAALLSGQKFNGPDDIRKFLENFYKNYVNPNIPGSPGFTGNGSGGGSAPSGPTVGPSNTQGGSTTGGTTTGGSTTGGSTGPTVTVGGGGNLVRDNNGAPPVAQDPGTVVGSIGAVIPGTTTTPPPPPDKGDGISIAVDPLDGVDNQNSKKDDGKDKDKGRDPGSNQGKYLSGINSLFNYFVQGEQRAEAALAAGNITLAETIYKGLAKIPEATWLKDFHQEEFIARVKKRLAVLAGKIETAKKLAAQSGTGIGTTGGGQGTPVETPVARDLKNSIRAAYDYSTDLESRNANQDVREFIAVYNPLREKAIAALESGDYSGARAAIEEMAKVVEQFGRRPNKSNNLQDVLKIEQARLVYMKNAIAKVIAGTSGGDTTATGTTPKKRPVGGGVNGGSELPPPKKAPKPNQGLEYVRRVFQDLLDGTRDSTYTASALIDGANKGILTIEQYKKYMAQLEKYVDSKDPKDLEVESSVTVTNSGGGGSQVTFGPGGGVGGGGGSQTGPFPVTNVSSPTTLSAATKAAAQSDAAKPTPGAGQTTVANITGFPANYAQELVKALNEAMEKKTKELYGKIMADIAMRVQGEGR